MIRREATHAGSWYTDDPAKLGKLIDAWIAATPEEKRRKAASSWPPTQATGSAGPQQGTRTVL